MLLLTPVDTCKAQINPQKKMSAPAEEPAVEATTENKSADESNTKTETAKDSVDSANQNNNKPIKKVKSKKDLKNDPSRFDPPGVNFNAKLIGIDDVANARGDKMCQEAMYRLKVAVKQSGQHKQKVIVNVSLDGIRIIDVRTHATNHTHPVHRISFISRDITDARAFGYVYGAGEGKHKFFAIKTEKAAEALVLTLRDLFQVVYELKKQEVEDAKHKIEEPAPETTTEVKENQEPVYQVPRNGKPVENGTDPTYQVPSNNQPVQSEGPDLLQMETELETIERRIEQIDTMEELFKELEAPPTTSQTTPAVPASGGSAWASDLASLSQGMPQTQTQPMFSVGGAAFPGQPFPPTSSALPGGGQPFGQGGQPFGAAGQPFGGQPAAAGQPFGGQPAGQFGAVPQQQPAPFGQPNPFQLPSVPPRTGMGFPGGNFPGTGNFPPTPFPGTQQQGPAFPGVPPRPGAQPAVSITPANDPFGSDPFASNSAFEEGVLEPARLETMKEESQVTNSGKVDVFGDLVNIGGKTKASTPKDMFAELAAPEKKSLNELKVDKSPSPKPASPVGFQASGDPASAAPDPFGNTENPFGTSDPFANDPFASNSIGTSQPTAQPSTHQDALFGGNFFGDANDDDDAFNIPLPQGPPPPLPENIASQNLNLNPSSGPLPPPRPSVDTPPLPVHNPPLPPRPKSTSSDSTKSTSSLNSLTEPQNVSQQSTPPLPPRPKSNIDTKVVPRPRPRASLLKNSPNAATLSLTKSDNTHTDKAQTVKPTKTVINRESDSINENAVNCVKSNDSDKNIEQKQKISQSAIKDKTVQKESHKNVTSDTPEIMHRTSSTVADPFISTDPFASEDPFMQSDPFANDPFASDPFADNTQPASKDDPFTTVVTSPHAHTEADPFSVFDNTLSNDSAFKFERSSSKKGKVKISGKKQSWLKANDPFGMPQAFK
ncbi:disabled homolog 1-like isoform X2 [Mercenaria mercenaria]|uniref:disabled homolog 1-like isoform X2 n=1 Tax=Mercenaria mercenaria TaxID=6596 RepID=UPI00234F0514|nr:disabled homolog 1-like isoform X2 [Mercenaria mercenaria]